MSSATDIGTSRASRDGAEPLPSGEVTILFTDVEGSTAAWERHPEAMPRAMRLHKGIISEAVSEHAGAVIKDTGDGLFAVFVDAAEAVAAAVDAQAGLEAARWGETGPLRARMGLHSGEAEPIGRDYHGPALNRCARIMGVAHGGQIVLSSGTRERLGWIPADVSFIDLGPHRLRDLSTPVHLFQALHPALPREFPPLRSLDRLANNLPAELSSFVGREAELLQVAEALGGTRLLTLSGPGGVGKTRLALQVAADQADGYGDGVWLASLGGIADPASVAPAVASALRIGDQPGRAWLDSILWYLRSREVLLILDNCEHLLDEVAVLVVAVLRDCPRVRVMTTSREALNVPGETVWHVPPLSLAAAEGESEAQRLFIERAREVEPGFRTSDADRAAIAQICSRLDGIPLAIELAAARERVLSSREIADRLHQRFRLLTGGSRTALPRQRTLEATVAWSYELLSESERHLFDRLSVFAGHFSLDSVERVCTDGEVQADDVLDLLTGLADKSLVVHEQANNASRYRLLETMRAYGLDRLGDRGELETARVAHLTWVNDFVRSVELPIRGAEQEGWLDLVADTLDDVRVALAWALESERSAIGLGCAASLHGYWYIRNVREGRLWLDRLLAAATDVPPKLLAKALFASGSLAQAVGDSEVALSLLERSLPLYRQTNNELGFAWALYNVGLAHWCLKEPRLAKTGLQEALEIFRRVPDQAGVVSALAPLAVWEYMFGDYARAQQLADEQLQLVRIGGAHPQAAAHAVETAAVVRWKCAGDVRHAGPLFAQALKLYRDVRSPLCSAHCLGNTAAWALHTGATRDAARLQGAMDGLREEAGRVVPAPYENLFDETTRDALVTALTSERYQRELDRGRALDLDHAIDAAVEIIDRAGSSLADAGSH
jgi:predicted ATPase/class 3 adenylate cyclase/tetratricopeptide (TPR) repeat protein